MGFGVGANGLEARSTVRGQGGDAGDAVFGQQLGPRVVGGGQQGVEHGAGAVGGGEELAGVFDFQLDAALGEEVDRVADGEALENLFDRVAAAAGGVVNRPHDVMGDVAAPAAGDEDLGAELFSAVERDDARVRRGGAGGEDCGEQPRGAGADDGDVGVCRGGERHGAMRSC